MGLTREILIKYKAQNPKKYVQKFGDKSIEEILGQTSPTVPSVATPIKVEIKPAEAVEAGFAKGATQEGVPMVAPKKRGRKVKAK